MPEPQDPIIDTGASTTPEPTNVNDLIEKARTEERQKLYASIQKKEDKIKEAEKQLQELQSKDKEFEDFKNKVELEKLEGVQRLEKEREQLQKKVLDGEKIRQQETAILNEKIRIYELAQFKTDKVRDSGLDPDFADMVFGSTQEEIIQSIDKAKIKEAKIKEKFSQAVPTPDPISAPTTNPGAPYPNLTVDPPDIRQVKTRQDLEEMKIKLGLKPNV